MLFGPLAFAWTTSIPSLDTSGDPAVPENHLGKHDGAWLPRRWRHAFCVSFSFFFRGAPVRRGLGSAEKRIAVT